MNNIMIDIETLDNKPTAAIISIAAAFFDPLTGEIGSTVYIPVDFADAQDEGATIGANTVKWWMKQNSTARAEITSNMGLPLSESPYKFNDFCNFCDDRETLKIYARGTDFDLPVIYHSMRLTGISPVWNYWNTRDVRTVAEIALTICGHSSMRAVLEHPHHAMNDVINQVARLSDDIKNISAVHAEKVNHDSPEK
ncbi:3'-5' exoribonuclease [Escherichia coli]|nr:3'-5' exoribonuclease [Escherichia coli]